MTSEKTGSELEDISFRQLKLLETVGRVKSVRQTSEECNLSQPAVTQAIAKLELLLGIQLLERGSHGSFLTSLGEIFYFRTRRFFDLYHRALEQLPITGGAQAVEATANRISRSQIRSLFALYDNADIEEATEALGICQASLLRATRTLERNVGKPLLGRDANGPVLNFAGMEFARRMRLALQEIEAGKREMDLEQGQAISRLTIGAMPLGGSVLIASVLDAFLRKYPEVEVKVVMESSAELIRSLKAGSVEFVVGLVPEKNDAELTTERLSRTPFKIVGRKGHPLADKADITLDDLLQYEWIIGTKGASRRECFERIFVGTSGPKTAVRTSSSAIFKALLRNSDRLVLLTDYELMNENEALCEIPYKLSSPAPFIGITSRADWVPIKLQSKMLEEIRKCTLGGATEAA